VRDPDFTVLGNLSASRCHLGDLIHMGLTVPIMLRDRRDAFVFVDRILRASVLSKDAMPWRVTFEMLVRAGVPLAMFAATPRTYLDLVLIDFSMPVFLAAGGTAKMLRDMTLQISADPVNLLEQFRMSKTMQRHLGTCFSVSVE